MKKKIGEAERLAINFVNGNEREARRAIDADPILAAVALEIIREEWCAHELADRFIRFCEGENDAPTGSKTMEKPL
jgi:hypothetical protein